MKRAWLNFSLVAALFWMLFSLLSSKGGWGERLFLESRLAEIERDVAEQKSVNAVLREHLENLYSGHHAIETVARYRLGMIQEDEVFVQFLIERPRLIPDTPAQLSIPEQPIESPLPFNPIDD
jgi:cell division protein FtsB